MTPTEVKLIGLMGLSKDIDAMLAGEVVAFRRSGRVALGAAIADYQRQMALEQGTFDEALGGQQAGEAGARK